MNRVKKNSTIYLLLGSRLNTFVNKKREKLYYIKKHTLSMSKQSC